MKEKKITEDMLDALRKKVSEGMSEKRFRHTAEVEKMVARLAELYATEPWNQLTAVKNNAVYNIPVGFVGFEQTCSTSALFIYSQANQLYPELFNYDMIALTKDYMQRYFGYTLTDEAAENMINGYFKDGSTMIE